MLSEQLRGAAAVLGSLNQLENGANLRVFVGEQITGQGGAEREDGTFAAVRPSTVKKRIFAV